jgi:hypothetical protein
MATSMSEQQAAVQNVLHIWLNFTHHHLFVGLLAQTRVPPRHLKVLQAATIVEVSIAMAVEGLVSEAVALSQL